MRSIQILMCGLLFVIVGSVFFVVGQERRREQKSDAQVADGKPSATGDQIEVKEDRFSGVTTVKLRPQVILDKPDHRLTIEVTARLGEKKIYDHQKDEIRAIANFESQSKTPVSYGDRELHFMVNGAPLNLGKVDIEVDPNAGRYNKLQPGFKIRETFLKIIDRSGLELFSKANRVETRLGPIEFVFDQSLNALLREYSNQVLAQHKIVKERRP
ncbi:MAG: hypothetical protein L0220_21220 [Acidobacteria bacterium]|nr:hypothetical protein [Acidobacteriota bacterium]